MHLAYEYVFALYMFFLTFGVINVVIGLFCERALQAAAGDRHLRTVAHKDHFESFVLHMMDIFVEMDTKGTGEINWQLKRIAHKA